MAKTISLEEAKKRLSKMFAKQLGCESIEQVDEIARANLQRSKKK